MHFVLINHSVRVARVVQKSRVHIWKLCYRKLPKKALKKIAKKNYGGILLLLLLHKMKFSYLFKTGKMFLQK